MSRLPAPEIFSAPADTIPAEIESQSKSSSIEIQQPELQKRKGITFISSVTKDEPIVTKKELWSYYRMLQHFLCFALADFFSQYTATETMYVHCYLILPHSHTFN